MASGNEPEPLSALSHELIEEDDSVGDDDPSSKGSSRGSSIDRSSTLPKLPILVKLGDCSRYPAGASSNSSMICRELCLGSGLSAGRKLSCIAAEHSERVSGFT